MSFLVRYIVLLMGGVSATPSPPSPPVSANNAIFSTGDNAVFSTGANAVFSDS